MTVSEPLLQLMQMVCGYRGCGKLKNSYNAAVLQCCGQDLISCFCRPLNLLGTNQDFCQTTNYNKNINRYEERPDVVMLSLFVSITIMLQLDMMLSLFVNISWRFCAGMVYMLKWNYFHPPQRERVVQKKICLFRGSNIYSGYRFHLI